MATWWWKHQCQFGTISTMQGYIQFHSLHGRILQPVMAQKPGVSLTNDWQNARKQCSKQFLPLIGPSIDSISGTLSFDKSFPNTTKDFKLYLISDKEQSDQFVMALSFLAHRIPTRIFSKPLRPNLQNQHWGELFRTKVSHLKLSCSVGAYQNSL